MQTIRLRVNEKVYKNLIRLLSKWAELRQAQLKVLSVPNTGMAVTIDLGEPLRLFEISNDGRNFHIALASIEGDKVIIWNENIINPTVVRYAWSNNPFKANLYSEEGLPASPFEIRE